MYFKTNPGKKAVKLMLGNTLLGMRYNRTKGIPVINGEESDPEYDIHAKVASSE
jgi:hypothetical protein